MKRCPQCNRVETDDALAFCRADGTALIGDSGPVGADAGTVKLASAPVSSEIETSILPHTTDSMMNRSTAPTTVLPAQKPPGTTQALSKPKHRKAIVAIASLIVVALIAAAYLYWPRGKNAAAPIESIAVLPFQVKNSDADTEYLSDGLADSLIFRLSQLPNLKVSPTSSVIRYKGKDMDIAQIAKELEVDAVMSGRVSQRGGDLTINVELIDTRTKKLLWVEQYDRKMTDLLAMQREIATAITQKLQLKLSGEGETGLTKRITDNDEAYQFYLKGRYHYARRTKDDIQRGIDYFQQAIKLDPNFALAYVGIADSYNSMPSLGVLSPKEAIPQAKAAAKRALDIDPTLAEAHAALADSIALFDFDWVVAEREFKRAIELNPNVAQTRYRYAIDFLLPMGRTEEAITELKRALELEPIALIINANLAAAYMYARQNDRAVEKARKTYDLEPSFQVGGYWLATVYNASGMYDEAIALCEQFLKNDPNNPRFLAIAGYGHAKAGRRREAEEIIKRYKEIGSAQYVSRYWLAAVYTALGDKDEGFAELDKSFEQRDYFLPRIKVDPFMDPLRDDPRFKAMLKRLNLPE